MPLRAGCLLTAQTASGYRRELAPVAHELDGLLRGAMTPLMLANESDLRSNVAEKRAELNTLNAEVARLAKLQVRTRRRGRTRACACVTSEPGMHV